MAVRLRQPNFRDEKSLRASAGRILFRQIIWFATALLVSGTSQAAALEPITSLANYGRQAWAMENGLPQNTVQALAQTNDGFLWLGTEAGLVRFDGVEFQTYDHNSNPALPGNDIRCLLASADGALWIGTNAGLARWKGEAVTVFTSRDGLPGNGILALEENSDGELLVSTDTGAAELSGDRFVGVTVEEFLAARGRGPRPGSKAVMPKDAIEYSAQMNGGQFAIGSKSTVLVFRNDIVAARLTIGAEISGSRIQTIFADREGALWIGTNAGLVRWVNGKVERFPETDSLATASILALMEDREGDLWIGTETGGMDVLRDQGFRTIDARNGLTSDRVTTIVEDGAGTLWVGTQEDGLNALRRDEATDSWRVGHSFSVKNGLASDVILSLAAAPNDDLWVGTPDGLSRIRGGQVETFSSADGLPDDFIRSLLIDADGSLWIGTRRGLTHWAVGKSGAGIRRGDEDLHACERAGQRPGGRDGAGQKWRLVGRDIGWVVAAAWRHDLKLHDRKRPLKQCGDGAAGARRWDAADWHRKPRLGYLGRK